MEVKRLKIEFGQFSSIDMKMVNAISVKASFYLFIDAVRAVRVSVAAPPERDAVIDAARKLGVLGALGVGAAVLV